MTDDWLQDPLITWKEATFSYRQLKGQEKDKQQKWRSFHFSTRLKLDGADHFCRQVLGATSIPSDRGLPQLADRQKRWYLDAFFFELIAAYDTLLQELNIIYGKGLEPNKVNWGNIKDSLPSTLRSVMEEKWKADWFQKVRWYRNTGAHWAYISTGELKVGFETPEHVIQSSLWYWDDSAKQRKEELIEVCCDYLNNMAALIGAIWQEMAEKFERL